MGVGKSLQNCKWGGTIFPGGKFLELFQGVGKLNGKILGKNCWKNFEKNLKNGKNLKFFEKFLEKFRKKFKRWEKFEKFLEKISAAEKVFLGGGKKEGKFLAIF